MNRTDRYVLRQFVQTFLFGLLAFAVIYIVVDLIENLEDYTDRNVPFLPIVKYYLLLLPEIIKLVLPIAMLLAGLFTFSRLEATHELTAIRSAGQSVHRIMRPLLLFGFLVGAGMIAFNGWVVPMANVSKNEFDRQYMNRGYVGGASNVFVRVSPTLNLQMDYFDRNASVANTVSLERLDSTTLLLLPRLAASSGDAQIGGVDSIYSWGVVERIDAQKMEYDSTTGDWTMISGIARNMRDPEHVEATPFDRRVVPGLGITPEELNLSQQSLDEMTLAELNDLVDREERSGRDVRELLIDYHSRYSLPFAAFIVIFFGIPFTSAQRKGGVAIPIAMTALISAIYFIFTEVSKTLSFTADVSPVVTAWIANVIFLGIGLLNLWRVERG